MAVKSISLKNCELSEHLNSKIILTVTWFSKRCFRCIFVFLCFLFFRVFDVVVIFAANHTECEKMFSREYFESAANRYLSKSNFWRQEMLFQCFAIVRTIVSHLSHNFVFYRFSCFPYMFLLLVSFCHMVKNLQRTDKNAEKRRCRFF